MFLVLKETGILHYQEKRIVPVSVLVDAGGIILVLSR
jgi:hypothetical protein